MKSHAGLLFIVYLGMAHRYNKVEGWKEAITFKPAVYKSTSYNIINVINTIH